MTNGDRDESHRLFQFGILLLVLSLLGVLAAIRLLEPDEGGGVAVLISGFLYPCGVFLLIRSRPAASRQSHKLRGMFISGIVLVILAPLGLLAIGCYVAIAALGAGLGDAPASSFWSSPLVFRAWLASAVPVVILGCGIYQLIRSTSRSPAKCNAQESDNQNGEQEHGAV
jgi:hypothetical protein